MSDTRLGQGRAYDPLAAWGDTDDARDFAGLGALFHKHGSRRGDAVALTFDDGPVANTEAAVDILDAYGAKGTFFFVGEKVRGREELVRRMVAAGHEVGNHSSHHRFFPSPPDIHATSSLLRGVTGSAPRVYRPPFGAIDTATASVVREAGMVSVSWDVDSEDVFPVYEGLEPREVYRNVIAGLSRGSIVLMHDGQAWSRAVEALPAILTTLGERGLRAVTVSELLGGANGSNGSGEDGARASARPRGPERAHQRPRRGLLRRLSRPRGGEGAATRPPRRVPDGWALAPPPVQKRQLMEMRPEEVVDLLERWEPSGGRRKPTREGLARALVGRVIAAPVHFAALADRLSRVEPVYLEFVLKAFTKAVEHDFRLDWEAAVTLAEGTLARAEAGGDVPAERASGDHAPELRPVRREAGRLLSASLSRRHWPSEGTDERLWRCLDRMSWDGLPEGGGDTDPTPLAEEVRAQALQAIVDYAVWRRDRDDSRARFAQVLENLDAHLDPGREPSTVVRGVYGRQLARLHSLDPDWVVDRIDRVLPDEPGLSALRDAAWSEYLAWGAPRGELLALVGEHLRRSVAALPSPLAARTGQHHDPGRILARKLATLLERGDLDLSPGGLLDEFVARAAADELGYLVRFIGLLAGDDPPTDDEATKLLVGLWELIVERVAARPPEERAHILSRFGFWYANGGVDRRWSEEQITALLEDGILVVPGFRVLQRLAATAGEDPGRAVAIALLYVGVAEDPWELHAGGEHLRAVVDAGRAAPDEGVRRRAEELAEALPAEVSVPVTTEASATIRSG